MLLNKRTTSENTRYPTKRLRTRLTFAQKKDVCVKLSSKPKPSQGELAEEYGVKQNTISDIWKNKEKWLAINSESKEFNRMSNRRPLFPQVEAALVSDGEEEIETVSIKNVLESLDNVFNFLVHPPAGFNCDASTVSTGCFLQKRVLIIRNSQC